MLCARQHIMHKALSKYLDNRCCAVSNVQCNGCFYTKCSFYHIIFYYRHNLVVILSSDRLKPKYLHKCFVATFKTLCDVFQDYNTKYLLFI